MIRNPYAKKAPRVPPLGVVNRAQNTEIMGRQSQQRVSNTKRAFQNAAYTSSSKKKKIMNGGKEKIFRSSELDCRICILQAKKRRGENVTLPHRPHHILCSKNGATKGKGFISDQSLANIMEARRLETLFNKPLAQHEKCGLIRTQNQIDSFFTPRTKKVY